MDFLQNRHSSGIFFPDDPYSKRYTNPITTTALIRIMRLAEKKVIINEYGSLS